MLRKGMGLLGVLALLAALAGPAAAQEEKKEWVLKTDGKRYWRVEEFVKPLVMPTTIRIEVAAGEQKEGDVLGFKYVGKRMERMYFREVPRATEPVKAHECTWRTAYVKKSMIKEHFCLMNGAEKPCPGMNAAGECLAQK